jgi:non-ribosomal peptide synthetase component F
MAQRAGATLFMALLAAFKALLLAHSGRNDLCVATAMANRTQVNTERVVGPFVNTALIRTRIDAGISFQEAVKRVREVVLEAYAMQELPLDVVVERLAEEDGVDPASLVQVSFVLHNAFEQPLDLPGVSVRPVFHPEGQQVMPINRSWLTVALAETAAGVGGAWSYKTDLLRRKTVRRWIADYRIILAKAAESPEISLGQLARLKRAA